MFKNVASQKIALFAFDTTTGAPKTGDAANITVYVSKDYGSVTVLGDTSASEMDSTNAKGWYLFDLTQSETNADALLFTGKSSTANVSVVGQLIFALPASFTSFTAPLTAAQVNAEVDTALADYDGPTNAEMVARTLASADYATATALQTVDDEIATLDTVADAIKAKTDSLTFTVAGAVDANVEHINAVEIVGDGSGGDPFNSTEF